MSEANIDTFANGKYKMYSSDEDDKDEEDYQAGGGSDVDVYSDNNGSTSGGGSAVLDDGDPMERVLNLEDQIGHFGQLRWYWEGKEESCVQMREIKVLLYKKRTKQKNHIGLVAYIADRPKRYLSHAVFVCAPSLLAIFS